MNRLAITLAAILTLTTSLLSVAEPVDLNKRAEELKSLRWGMFICWSFGTFSGKEWTPGVKDISLFRATQADTDQWARTAKEAGMGYILFLTKHHDGFCLWDTKTTDRKVTKAPLRRDVLAELRKSCDKYGIKLALYFSEGEFSDNKDYHPGGYTPEMKKAQLKELLTQYGPIDFIWFDHAQGDGGLDHSQTVAWCHQQQAATLIGFNNGQPAGEISLRERGCPGPLGDTNANPMRRGAESSYNGFLVAEFTYPIEPPHEGGAQWFYSMPKYDSLCRPAEALYRDYLGAGKYGNIFSLDVGPDYEGRLRDIDVETLRKVGAMIRNPPPIPVSEGGTARASSEWSDAYNAAKAIDGDTSTRWAAQSGSRSGWIEVDLGKETPVDRAVVMELGFHRTQAFAIEYKVGDVWKELYRSTKIGGTRTCSFPTVTARCFRLNILQASDTPTIEEFQLFAR